MASRVQQLRQCTNPFIYRGSRVNSLERYSAVLARMDPVYPAVGPSDVIKYY